MVNFDVLSCCWCWFRANIIYRINWVCQCPKLPGSLWKYWSTEVFPGSYWYILHITMFRALITAVYWPNGGILFISRHAIYSSPQFSDFDYLSTILVIVKYVSKVYFGLWTCLIFFLPCTSKIFKQIRIDCRWYNRLTPILQWLKCLLTYPEWLLLNYVKFTEFTMSEFTFWNVNYVLWMNDTF